MLAKCWLLRVVVFCQEMEEPEQSPVESSAAETEPEPEHPDPDDHPHDLSRARP